jgi:hypothetical protein
LFGGKTYKLSAILKVSGNSFVDCNYNFVDSSNTVLYNSTAGKQLSPSHPAHVTSNPMATATITPLADMDVKLRVAYAGATYVINGYESWIQVEQLY